MSINDMEKRKYSANIRCHYFYCVNIFNSVCFLLQIKLDSFQHAGGAPHKNAQTQQLVELTPEERKWSLFLYLARWECEKSQA